MHDLGAELQGYRDELADIAGDADREKAVRKEIARVSKAIEERADELEAQADEHQDAGQDVAAAQARVEARRHRALIEEPAAEDTADSTPREKAVPRRGGRKNT